MKIDKQASTRNRCAGQQAFTLLEVVIATAIAALVMAGMFQGYNMAGRRAQYSACSIAANSEAVRIMELVVSIPWVETTPGSPLFSATNTIYTNLCLPSALSNVITCTDYTTVRLASSNPPYAMIQVQCVWGFPSYGGTFTNTVATIRAPNQ
ncbi:MAG: prepilin-type N-terminal cleavage/methylation domain-containing protein [Verrucomicrobiota bacterium]|jgi:prepilin-type N-terminal cleavage/methylation domain-containing protein